MVFARGFELKHNKTLPMPIRVVLLPQPNTMFQD